MNQATLPKRSSKQQSTTNRQLQNHFDRAEIISRYGDAIKKFDWLIYIVFAFVLLLVSSYLSTTGRTMEAIAVMVKAATILLKKKTD